MWTKMNLGATMASACTLPHPLSPLPVTHLPSQPPFSLPFSFPHYSSVTFPALAESTKNEAPMTHGMSAVRAFLQWWGCSGLEDEEKRGGRGGERRGGGRGGRQGLHLSNATAPRGRHHTRRIPPPIQPQPHPPAPVEGHRSEQALHIRGRIGAAHYLGHQGPLVVLPAHDPGGGLQQGGGGGVRGAA